MPRLALCRCLQGVAGGSQRRGGSLLHHERAFRADNVQLKTGSDRSPLTRLRTQTRNPAVRTFPDGKAQVVVDKLRPVSFGGSGWPVMMSEPQQTCRLGLHFCAMTVGVGIMISSQSVAAQPALAVVPHLQLASVSTQASGFEAYKRYLMQQASRRGLSRRTCLLLE